MLFYERRLPEHLKEKHAHLLASPNTTTTSLAKSSPLIKQTNDDEPKDDAEENKSKINDENSTKMEVESEELNKSNTANCDNKTKENDKIIEKEQERRLETETPSTSTGSSSSALTTSASQAKQQQQENPWRPQLSKELEDWIWQDNRQFLQDRNIFEHTYFK